MNPLALLGQYATGVLALGVALGLFLPGLADFLPPFLPLLVFIFTAVSFLKAELGVVRPGVRLSAVVALLLFWVLIAAPVLVGALAELLRFDPQLESAIAVWAASPPMTAAIMFAVLLGLDVMLATAACLLGLLIVPLTGPLMGVVVSGFHIAINPVELIMRSVAFVGFAALLALFVRRVAGRQRLQRYERELSGITVAVLLLYAATLMSSVRDAVFSDLTASLYYVGVACMLNLLLQAATFFFFARSSSGVRTTAALLAGNRNMGVLYANLGPALTPEITLFFAATHIPVYTFPHLLRPVYFRAMAHGRAH